LHHYQVVTIANTFECAKEVREREKKRTGVNFINILRTNFSYDRHFGSFFYLHFGFVEKFVQKTRAYNVDEIDYWGGKAVLRDSFERHQKETE